MEALAAGPFRNVIIDPPEKIIVRSLQLSAHDTASDQNRARQ
jgi:hypothetical protein